MLGLLGVIIAAAVLEGLVKTFLLKQAYDWRAFAASLGDLVGRRAMDALGLSLAAPLLAWAYAHRVFSLELSTPMAFGLLFFGQEFLYYGYHRAAHRVRWFWATHAVHHSPNELTLMAALRLGWTGKLTGTALFFVPLVWLGFSPTAVLGVVSLNLLYQFWLHAPWMPRLGPLEWVFNTPAHHSVHHASNPEYLDKNFGGVLIVFDRLFGSFAAAQPGVTIRYGLTEPLHSYNPVRIALEAWRQLGLDLWSATCWRDRVFVLLGPPGGSVTRRSDAPDTRRVRLPVASPASSAGHGKQPPTGDELWKR
jgi:sterol desaturase/sphingolipid hydroxylase (fatty acid hydroxylase superfamily)